MNGGDGGDSGAAAAAPKKGPVSDMRCIALTCLTRLLMPDILFSIFGMEGSASPIRILWSMEHSSTISS